MIEFFIVAAGAFTLTSIVVCGLYLVMHWKGGDE
jgi:hypothetical protein